MGPWPAIKTGFSKTFRYSGRAARSEFWWLWLSVFVAFVFAVVLDIALFGKGTIGRAQVGNTTQYGIWGDGPFSIAVSLLMFFPLLAASARRMHDRSRSGWWLALPFLLFAVALAYGFFARNAGTVDAYGNIHLSGAAAIPGVIPIFAGFGILIWNFISLLRRGHPGPNPYGPNPLEAQS